LLGKIDYGVYFSLPISAETDSLYLRNELINYNYESEEKKKIV